MGRRGPPKGSASAKRCASNRKRPKEALARGHRPGKPSWLAGEASREWTRIVPELEAAGCVEKVDRAALAAYCQSWAELVEATKIIDAEGRMVREPIQDAVGTILGHRVKPHPAARLQRDALGRVKAFVAEFGLSPAARSRMSGEQAQAAAATEKVNRLQEIGQRVQATRSKAAPGPDA